MSASAQRKTRDTTCSLLWIDDEPCVINSCRQRLISSGIEVQAAVTGELGLEFAQRDSPDIIILDYRIADTSGLDVLAQLRRDGIETPVLFLTAHGDQDAAFLAGKLGATAYYEKPLLGQRLISAIRDVLNRSKKRGSPRHPSLPRRGDDHADRGSALEHSDGSRPCTALPGAAQPVSGPGKPYTPMRLPKGTSARRQCASTDLESASELLSALATILSSQLHQSEPPRSPEPLRGRLLGLVITAMTGSLTSAPPVFWAFARAIRTVGASGAKDTKPAAEAIHELVRDAVESVRSARPTVCDVATILESRILLTRGRISFQSLCTEFETTRNYLAHFLKTETGLTFRQWRWAILMRAAVWELTSSEENVRQIAFAIGYDHPSQFDRDFGRAFGMSPGHFRRLRISHALPKATSNTAEVTVQNVNSHVQQSTISA